MINIDHDILSVILSVHFLCALLVTYCLIEDIFS